MKVIFGFGNRFPELLFMLMVKMKKRNLSEMSGIICDEVNVKKIDFIDSPDDLIRKEAKANFKILGTKIGKLMGKIAPIIELFSREQIDNFEQNGFERVVLMVRK